MADVAAGLKAVGYDGPVVIESFTDQVKSIARAAAIWAAWPPGQDALASEGLSFLKRCWLRPWHGFFNAQEQ